VNGADLAQNADGVNCLGCGLFVPIQVIDSYVRSVRLFPNVQAQEGMQTQLKMVINYTPILPGVIGLRLPDLASSSSAHLKLT